VFYEEDNMFNDEDYGGLANVQDEVWCNINDKAGIHSSWILLDRQSTVDIFVNNKEFSRCQEAICTALQYRRDDCGQDQ